MSRNKISKREKELLTGLASGKLCKQLGNKSTVHNILEETRYKLGAETTTQAVAIAIRQHLID